MKKSKWRISIDDQYVEYRFIVEINDDECIYSVYEKIRKLFRSRKRMGKLREEKTP